MILAIRMKRQRYEGRIFSIPQSVKNGALLLTAFVAWHFAGVAYYNYVSGRGQEKLRLEGVPEHEITDKKGYQRVAHFGGEKVWKLQFRTVIGDKNRKEEKQEFQE